MLLDEMDIMKERLSVLSSDVEKPLLEDMDDLFAFLEMLKMAIRSHNSDQADKVMKQLMAFSYPKDIQEKIEHLNIHVMNLDDEGALMDIDELQK